MGLDIDHVVQKKVGDKWVTIDNPFDWAKNRDWFDVLSSCYESDVDPIGSEDQRGIPHDLDDYDPTTGLITYHEEWHLPQDPSFSRLITGSKPTFPLEWPFRGQFESWVTAEEVLAWKDQHADKVELIKTLEPVLVIFEQLRNAHGEVRFVFTLG